MTAPDVAIDDSASDAAAAAATVVSIFALLIAVVGAGDVGRLSSTVAASLLIAASVIAAIAFRSLFNRAHVLAAAAALALTLMGTGRAAILVLPLLVVVGALHLASIEQRFPRTIPVWRTAAAAFVAFLAAVVLEGITFGPFSNPNREDGGGGQERAEPAQVEPATEPNAVQRFVERVAEFFRRDGESQPREEVTGRELGSPPPPETGGIDWIKLLLAGLLMLAILALIALLVRWWRRRASSVSAGDVRPDSVLRRLERIGETAARGRRGSEGPITYGTAVNELTGDRRLSEAGSIVSDYVYRPDGAERSETDAAALDRALADLEATPPRPLEQPPTRRARTRAFVMRFINRR